MNWYMILAIFVVLWVLSGLLICLYWQVRVNKYMDIYYVAFLYAILNGPFEWFVGRGVYNMFYDNPISYLLWMERKYGAKRGKF